MPVFLDREAWDEYLQPGELDAAGQADVLALITAESERMAGTIEIYVVDCKINSTRTVDRTDSTLIAPVR